MEKANYNNISFDWILSPFVKVASDSWSWWQFCFQEIKLQEAIFELYNGEEDLVDDLKLVRKTYADSLIHLNILKPDEEKLGNKPQPHG
jgi:hypothetical protein